MHEIVQPTDSNRDLEQLVAFGNSAQFRQRKLAVFARNCQMLSERVAVGQIRLIDAVDMLQSAAELSGLCETVGDDLVQQVLATAFTGSHTAVPA